MEGAQRGSIGDAELEWHFGGDKGGRGMHGVGQRDNKGEE